MSINTTLKSIGLNDKEVIVYLALQKHGKALPAHIARVTKINRATVYNILKGLQSKGIITEDLSGKTLYFAPLPGENLKEIVERPRRELEEKSVLINKAIEELSLITPNGNKYPIPRIRFVEEQDMENFLSSNIEKWQKNTEECDGIWWGPQDPTFLKEFKDWMNWYWKQTWSKKTKMHMVSNDSEVEREMYKKHSQSIRDIRFAKDMNFNASTWIGGDYLIMLVTNKHPFYLYEIYDKALAENMRTVFKKLWSELPQIKL